MPRFLPLARRYSSRLSLARGLAVVALPFALAAGLLPGQAARAQPLGPAQIAQAEKAAEVGGFSAETLQAYATAVLKVQAVDNAWQPRLTQAETAEEIESLTRQATDEMIGEIEAQGLTLRQYNAITKAAEQDDRLYDHIMTLLAEAR
ncbi:DUF4168 domain-containing protein [Pelagibius marinus]|uniref:DUF4168 domain-containing protein n=1 Tax=Pelagibius marinus TaxID=2762760 RepID=UPI001872FBAB|nr:DUF4168 domain-containing protein [Pelagibius marinus]